MMGYDGPVSLEMEDLTMSVEAGIATSIDALKQNYQQIKYRVLWKPTGLYISKQTSFINLDCSLLFKLSEFSQSEAQIRIL